MHNLETLVSDPSRIIRGRDIEEKYLSDALGRRKGRAEALIFPASTAEVSKILAFASSRGIPVTPRGAGTNLVGSATPLSGGLVLDFSRMNRLLEIDPETLTATVEPGIMLDDFQKAVEAQGLFYPPDPGEKRSSIGGNISTNAGGMRAVKYGVTRDYVRGLQVVKADGSILMLGSKNVKDTTGLALKQLLIGSEGALGVITRCILRLLPKPGYTFSILLAFPSLKASLLAVNRLLMDGATPVALEFIERDVIALGEAYTGVSFPFPAAKAYIIVSYDGGSPGEAALFMEEAMRRQVERVRNIADDLQAEGLEVMDSKERLAAVWGARGSLVKAVEAVSEQEPLDIVVPIDKIGEFIEYIQELEQETGVRMVRFGHAGDGNVHLCVLRENRDNERWEKELSAALKQAYKKVYAIGGLISGEHGIGYAKQPYFLQNTQREVLELMQGIKSVFDPSGILNPGKIFHIPASGSRAGQ